MKNLKVKEGQYLLLDSDNIITATVDEQNEIEGNFNTSHDFENIKEVVERAVCYYMTEDGQLIRSIPILLKIVLQGVQEAYDSMQETNQLKDSEILIEKAFKKACHNF